MPKFTALVLGSDSAVLLALENEGAKILASLDLQRDAGAAAAAETIIASLDRNRARRGFLAILFQDDLCYPVTADVDLGLARSPKPLAYALEESLPIDADASIVGIARRTGSRLAVAIDLQRHAELLRALGGAGIPIGFTNSVGLLELQAQVESAGNKSKFSRGSTIWSLASGDCSTFLATDSGRAIAWLTDAADGTDCELPIRLLELQLGKPANVVRLPNPAGASDHGAPAVSSRALELARKCTAGSIRPWIEFPPAYSADSREASWRTPAAVLCACSIVGLLLAAAGLVVRSLQYQHRFDQMEAAKVALFSEAFPGQRVPIDIERTLQSMWQSELAGQQAQTLASDNSDLLNRLRDVVLALPESEENRFQLTSIDVEAKYVRLRGDVKELGSLEHIRAAFDRASLNSAFEQFRARDFSLRVGSDQPGDPRP